MLHRTGRELDCKTTKERLHRLLIPHPIISNEDMAALKHIDHKHVDHRQWRSKTVDITFAKAERR